MHKGRNGRSGIARAIYLLVCNKVYWTDNLFFFWVGGCGAKLKVCYLICKRDELEEGREDLFFVF